MKKKKRLRKERKNVANVVGSHFEMIDHMWAQNGVVHVRTKEGKVSRMSIQQAVHRASAINKSRIPGCHASQKQELLEKIIQTCREAKYQVENNDRGAVLVNNALEGKTSEGQPVEEFMSEEDRIRGLQFKYYSLSDTEIAAALRSDFPEPAKMQLLQRMHAENIAQGNIPNLVLPADG